ncbi:hypothetical protein PIB30_022410 [Stylosanthes scabra]|uniref:Uncharacterized protein n=1 Tax=Stylosanthes scabra TaxID=79078 RepID=A0ABU6Z6M5_9FABA|nr:hypothetical protein [Stylosanthes scabra]
MALIPSSQPKIKNRLVLLTIRTLKFQDHLDPSKTPTQFEEIDVPDEKDSSNDNKNPKSSEAEAVVPPKKSKSPTIIQESEKYTEWAQHDSALMTWLDASMTITFKNKVVNCTTFAESWETITHIFTVSSKTRIQSLKTQLRTTKKIGTIKVVKLAF